MDQRYTEIFRVFVQLTRACVMMAPSTELASLYFSFPVMKSQIPKRAAVRQYSKR